MCYGARRLDLAVLLAQLRGTCRSFFPSPRKMAPNEKMTAPLVHISVPFTSSIYASLFSIAFISHHVEHYVGPQERDSHCFQQSRSIEIE